MGIPVVDDSVENGQWPEFVWRHCSRAHFAAVCSRPVGGRQADTFVTGVDRDTRSFLPREFGPRHVKPWSGAD